ncbi:hypothetical protein DFS34DRAFT_630680 [Phlyctochytrium arcticum]|nr:hypothetical protein DFS34DRAFT_630680 [Phlyctochytrium arcticum]
MSRPPHCDCDEEYIKDGPKILFSPPRSSTNKTSSHTQPPKLPTKKKRTATMVKTTTALSILLTGAAAATTAASAQSTGLPFNPALPEACQTSLKTNIVNVVMPCGLASLFPLMSVSTPDAYLKAIDGLMANNDFLGKMCSGECTAAMTTLQEKSGGACGTAPLLSIPESMVPGANSTAKPETSATGLGLADAISTAKFGQTVLCPKTDDKASYCLSNRWSAFRTAYPDVNNLDLEKVVANNNVVCDGCVLQMHDLAAANVGTLRADLAKDVNELLPAVKQRLSTCPPESLKVSGANATTAAATTPATDKKSGSAKKSVVAFVSVGAVLASAMILV